MNVCSCENELNTECSSQTRNGQSSTAGQALFYIFGRPFVKQFTMCYQTVVCLSCLCVCPVCNVCVLWPNGWMDRDETWRAGRPRPGHIVLDGDPKEAFLGRGSQPLPNFRPVSVVVKQLDGLRCHFVRR